MLFGVDAEVLREKGSRGDVPSTFAALGGMAPFGTMSTLVGSSAYDQEEGSGGKLGVPPPRPSRFKKVFLGLAGSVVVRLPPALPVSIVSGARGPALLCIVAICVDGDVAPLFRMSSKSLCSLLVSIAERCVRCTFGFGEGANFSL